MNLEKSKIILQQLGGNRFIAMTGAKYFAGSNDGDLSFKIGRNASGITHVKIKLNDLDLYNIDFIRVRGTLVKSLRCVNNVYAEDLQRIFTATTGLDTHL